jgi:hypothetical protein
MLTSGWPEERIALTGERDPLEAVLADEERAAACVVSTVSLHIGAVSCGYPMY